MKVRGESIRKKKEEEKKPPIKLYVLSGLGGALVVGLLGYFIFGGSQTKPREQEPGEGEIRKMASIYSQFSRQKGKPPANVDEIKAWAKKLPKDQLGTMLIDDMDKTFISPRDNQPYVINHLPKGAFGPDIVVAYEKTGHNGKRWIVSPVGSVREVDEQEFTRLVPNAK